MFPREHLFWVRESLMRNGASRVTVQVGYFRTSGVKCFPVCLMNLKVAMTVLNPRAIGTYLLTYLLTYSMQQSPS